jgi:PAS domain S-box-containing protein
MSPSISAQARPEALQILLEASSLLLHAGSEEKLLSQMLDLASTLLVADAHGVWRDSDGGQSWRMIAQRGLSNISPYAFDLHGAVLPRKVWMVEDAQTEDLSVFAGLLPEKEGIRSAMVVPWMLDATVNGAIVYYWRQPRSFHPDDVEYALALSNLSVSALNRVELHEQNQREKRRLAFLAKASEVLASSLDYESTLERVAQIAVSQISDWCAVHVVEQDAVTRVAVAHADPSMASLSEEYSRKYPEQINPERGLGKVLRTAEPEVVSPIGDAMLVAAAQDEEHLRLLRLLKLSSSLLVPLVSHGKVLGAIRLLGTDGRYFGEDDLQLAMDLGRRAAVAIENAQLHRTLVEQDAELRLSHAAAKMGSWAWDLERDKVFWSAEFKALHGLPQETEANGELGYRLVHPEDRERAQREFWASLESTALVFNSEHRSITPEGRVIWLQVRGRIRRNASGKAIWIAGLIIDITDSRLAEQALRRTEKLAATGRLAATVAHEVNNPLESLVNLIYLAQTVPGLPEQAANHLRVADGELRRIAHIVRQALGFYRETASPQSTGVLALVSDVLELYRSRGESRGLTLRRAEQPDGEVCAMVIAGEIRQVVANLIANAIDATPAGGKVETSVRRVDAYVEIAVSDTGCGISEISRRHLFEPFFTTKADVGTGLGLWVSKGIVEKYGGTIVVDPPRERGTTIRVRIPAEV